MKYEATPPSSGRKRAVVGVAAYAITHSFTIVFAWAAVRNALPDYVVIGGPAVIVGSALFVLERKAYRHRSWTRYLKDVPTDIAYALMSGVGVSKLTDMLVRIGIVSVLADPSIRSALDVWPRSLPFPAQLAIAVLGSELLYYWVHRLSHEWPLLWRFHAIHHRPRKLYFLNSNRFHPVETALQATVFTLPLSLLGAEPALLLVHAAVNGVNGMMQHANLRIGGGPLSWILATNELHHWHHSRVASEGCTNYGRNLIVWDVLFGTRFSPADREPPEEVGIATEAERTLWADLAAPFRGRSDGCEVVAHGDRDRVESSRASRRRAISPEHNF